MEPDSSNRIEAHLRFRIARQHQLLTEPIRIGALKFPFTRIKEPDRVLDRIVEEEDRREKTSGVRKSGDDLHLPYWAELWDSALGVGQFLAKRYAGRESLSVLDLGCGMGLAGASAAALGHRVLLVDLEPEALLLAKLNTLRFGSSVRVRRVDWRTDRLNERFQIILGSDVLYERAQWESLQRFWHDHLHHDGAIILGEPGRQTGDVFPGWIAAKNWDLESLEEPVRTRERPIRIFRLQLR